MLRKITPEVAIAFAKLSLAISMHWPLPRTATKAQVVRYYIFRCLSFANVWLLLVPLLMTLQDVSTNPDIFIKSGPLIFGFLQTIIQTGLCQSQYRRFQLIIEEMESYCKNTKTHERKILQNYVDRCAVCYTAIISWFYLTAILVIFGPLFSTSSFPMEAKYPFEIVRQPLRTIIYAQQAYGSMQLASQISVNILPAVLLWFTGARFEIMHKDLMAISNTDELVRIIQEHQRVLRYANEVTDTIRYSVLNTIVFTILAVLAAGLTFVSRQPVIVKMQFFLMSIAGITEVFMCCWPADNLQVVSREVGQAAFESPWYSHTIHVQKNFLPLLLRCQKPVAVSISCVVPDLSLKYFGSYISTAFSYFTTLRVMLQNDRDDV